MTIQSNHFNLLTHTIIIDNEIFVKWINKTNRPPASLTTFITNPQNYSTVNIHKDINRIWTIPSSLMNSSKIKYSISMPRTPISRETTITSPTNVRKYPYSLQIKWKNITTSCWWGTSQGITQSSRTGNTSNLQHPHGQ